MRLASSSSMSVSTVHRKINGVWVNVILTAPQGYVRQNADNCIPNIDNNITCHDWYDAQGNAVSDEEVRKLATRSVIPLSATELLDVGKPDLTSSQATFNWLVTLQATVGLFVDLDSVQPQSYGTIFDPDMARPGASWTRRGLAFLNTLAAPGTSRFLFGFGVPYKINLTALTHYANHYPNVLQVYLQFLDFLVFTGAINPLDMATHTALANAAASAAVTLAANEDAASAAAHSSFFDGLKSLMPILAIALPVMAPSLFAADAADTAIAATGAADTAAAAATISPEAFASYGQAVEAGSVASESVAFAAQATLPEEITAAIANVNGAALTATAAAQDAIMTAAATAEPGNAVGDFFKSIATKVTSASPTQLLQVGKQAVSLMSAHEREQHAQLIAHHRIQHAQAFMQAGGTPEQLADLQIAYAAKTQSESGTGIWLIGAGLMVLLLT